MKTAMYISALHRQYVFENVPTHNINTHRRFQENPIGNLKKVEVTKMPLIDWRPEFHSWVLRTQHFSHSDSEKKILRPLSPLCVRKQLDGENVHPILILTTTHEKKLENGSLKAKL